MPPKSETGSTPETKISNTSSPFDRSIVLENTLRNAKLGVNGERVRAELQSNPPDSHTKLKYPKTKAPASLKFDEDDLEAYDATRGQHEIIDEPKTPYLGTAADTEYYQTDEDVPAPDQFSLGESL